MILRYWYVTEPHGGISKSLRNKHDKTMAKQTGGLWDPLKHTTQEYPRTYNKRCLLPPYECRPFARYGIGAIETHLPAVHTRK